MSDRRTALVPSAVQRSLALGEGTVHWETLPSTVRSAVLEMWVALLAAHVAQASTAAVMTEPTP